MQALSTSSVSVQLAARRPFVGCVPLVGLFEDGVLSGLASSLTPLAPSKPFVPLLRWRAISFLPSTKPIPPLTCFHMQRAARAARRRTLLTLFCNVCPSFPRTRLTLRHPNFPAIQIIQSIPIPVAHESKTPATPVCQIVRASTHVPEMSPASTVPSASLLFLFPLPAPLLAACTPNRFLCHCRPKPHSPCCLTVLDFPEPFLVPSVSAPSLLCCPTSPPVFSFASFCLAVKLYLCVDT